MLYRHAILCLLVVLMTASVLMGADEGLQSGDLAPTFFARSLDDDDFFLSRVVGERARAYLKGPVVLSFFTTSCIPCRKEIPFLHSLSKQFSEAHFYLINVGEEEHIIRKYVDQMGYSLPILLDKYGTIAKKYDAMVTPTLVVIQEDGSIRLHKHGFRESDPDHITAQLQEILRPQSVEAAGDSLQLAE